MDFYRMYREDDIMKKSKEFRIKACVIVFSLLAIFALPCVSFATSFSDIQLGNVDNSLKVSPDNLVSVGSDMNVNHRPRHEKVGGQQPQATPIPSPVWLLGTGIVGFFGIRRRLMRKK